jgi:hypothetical protein
VRVHVNTVGPLMAEYVEYERKRSNDRSYSDGCPSMKRTYFPGITDVVVVTDPVEIRAVSNESRLDRDFAGHAPVRNRQRLRRMLRIFSVNGRLFPTMLPRTDPSRAAAQDELWARLTRKADEVKRGPAALEPLAERDRDCEAARPARAAERREVIRRNVHRHR